MQPTISIPKHWAYPRFALSQRTQQGIILGFYYYPCGTELAEQFSDGWRYVLMPNKNSDETSYLQENQIQLFTPEELLSEITAEIEFYQQQIAILSTIPATPKLSVVPQPVHLQDLRVKNIRTLLNYP